MKTYLYIFAFGLLSGLSLSHVYAQNNTVYGSGAGTGGHYSTHIGYQVGKSSFGYANTFMGYLSGYNNAHGSNNTILGYLSGYNNTEGSNNTFLGNASGFSNTSGIANTFMGYQSGGSNTTGDFNTFVGNESGYNNTTGESNTFVGYRGGYYNTTGIANTFIGYQSGNHNTIGYSNTFLGTYSGYNNTAGFNNTFLGTYSGYENTTGSANTFLGFHSGKNNTTGSSNTFLGHLSGYNNTAGGDNIFLGYQSGFSNTTGSTNTYLGHFSGYNNKSGEKNVFIGYKAGYDETGSNKLYIDNNSAERPLLYGDFNTNVLSIGSKYKGTFYQLVVPGKVRAAEYWVPLQDGRGDIQVGRVAGQNKTLQDALAKVQKIETVSYKTASEESNLQIAKSSQAKAAQQVSYGFLPESMQEVFPALVMEEEGEVAINYQGMIPVLVEAIKELTRETQAEIARLQQELAILRQAIRDGTSAPALDDTAGAQLYQNYPNPFDQSSAIGYRVAAEARQVSLIITNLQGVAVQQYDNLSTGQGQVEIAAGSLGAGTYVYTLVVDGKPVAAHKMVLSR